MLAYPFTAKEKKLCERATRIAFALKGKGRDCPKLILGYTVSRDGRACLCITAGHVAGFEGTPDR